MTFHGAQIRQQGVTFAVVVVKKYVVDNRVEAQSAIQAFQPHFPGMPVVLMAQDYRGTPTYFGRRDIAAFLAKVPLSAIRWKQYTVAA
jgi:hypothetical protein